MATVSTTTLRTLQGLIESRLSSCTSLTVADVADIARRIAGCPPKGWAWVEVAETRNENKYRDQERARVVDVVRVGITTRLRPGELESSRRDAYDTEEDVVKALCHRSWETEYDARFIRARRGTRTEGQSAFWQSVIDFEFRRDLDLVKP